MRMSFLLLTGAAGLAAALPAQAIEQYTISNMTCASVQAALDQDGAAILRHASTRIAGMTLYDRYVSDSMYCAPHERAIPAGVPASDNPSCTVLQCAPGGDREEFRMEYPDTVVDSVD